MHSAITEAPSSDAILERLLARSGEDGISPADLMRAAKSLAGPLGVSFEAAIVRGAAFEFIDHQPSKSHTWARGLAPNDGLMMIADAQDPDRPAVMISVGFASVVVMAAGALGGDPLVAAEVANRNLTGYEKDFLSLFASAVNTPLSDIFPAGLHKVTAIPAGAFDPTAISDQPVTVLKYRIKLGEMAGEMGIAIPDDYLKSGRPVEKGQVDELGDDPLSSNIWNTRLRIEASIALPPATLGKLRNLSAGDIIPIPAANFDRGAIATRGRQIFAVQIGQLGDAFSFRVLHAVKKGGGFMGRVAESLSRAGHMKI
ncbi:MAG: FliM/FliN family flagellar motor switch protein [Notoacmeibacter sp.]|nr:FliM/FliN family flagellar motor switch protein [Notoacmeibacter sp.]